jgi:hypothetical protein
LIMAARANSPKPGLRMRPVLSEFHVFRGAVFFSESS